MPDDLDFFAGLDHAALDSAGGDGAASGDGEDVFHRHQEGQVHRASRGRDVRVDGIHQLPDLPAPLAVTLRAAALERLHRGTRGHRDLVAGELVLAEQVADFDLDQFEQFRVVQHVDLVEEDNDAGHVHLAGEQDVLAGLRHGAVRGGDHQDGAVHLRRAGNHVLDVVGVPRAVHVRVVALLGLVLGVEDLDGKTAFLFLGSRVDILVLQRLRQAGLRQRVRDGRRQRRLPMVHVADGADVHVRLGSLKFCLAHFEVTPCGLMCSCQATLTD